MSQQVISLLSQTVSIAYRAYQQNSIDPVEAVRSEAVALGLTLININIIYVSEPTVRHPLDGVPFFFGFTATVGATNSYPAINVIALRGTLTDYEFSVSMESWDMALTPCALPTAGKTLSSLTGQGSVHPAYWTFYQGSRDKKPSSSLAQSMQQAIKATGSGSGASSLPWFGTAHSLGGAMITLGVWDAFLAGLFKGQPVAVATFGSVAVGDRDFVAAYNLAIIKTWRVANLSDMIPSWRGLQDSQYSESYKHVGIGYLFVWQWDSNWKNHSLADVYMPATSPALYKSIYVDNPPIAYPAGIIPIRIGHGAGQAEEHNFASQVDKSNGSTKVNTVEVSEECY